MSLNCSDRATKEDLYGLLFSPKVFNCNLACEDLSSKRLSRQTETRALCSKKASRQTAYLSPWRIKGVCHSAPLSIDCFLLSCIFVSVLTRSMWGVCHSAPLSIDCFLLSCFFFSSLDGRKEGKRRSRRLRPPAKFAGYMTDSISTAGKFA